MSKVGVGLPDGVSAAGGLVDSFCLSEPVLDEGRFESRLYQHEALQGMLGQVIELASGGDMTLPEAIREVADRCAMATHEANEGVRRASGKVCDDERMMVRRVRDLAQFYQQMLLYEMLHTERAYCRHLSSCAACRDQVRAFIAREREEEPLFDSISERMRVHYQGLPYDEAQSVARAIAAFQRGDFSPEEAAVMEAYYRRVRRDLHGERLGLRADQAVPKVERGGGGPAVRAKRDFRELGRLSPRKQAQWIADLMQERGQNFN